MNENVIAIAIVSVSFGLALIGLDDGSLTKMVVSAFLGYLTAKRLDRRK